MERDDGDTASSLWKAGGEGIADSNGELAAGKGISLASIRVISFKHSQLYDLDPWKLHSGEMGEIMKSVKSVSPPCKTHVKVHRNVSFVSSR